MSPDMTVPCGEGIINIRVGAIILKDGKKVTDILQVEEGNRITIMMKDGKVTFTAGDVLSEKKEEDSNS